MPVKKRVILDDVSNGRERNPVVVVNDVDDCLYKPNFTYISRSISGRSVTLPNNPRKLQCCSCEDACEDPRKCECLQRTGGITYDADGCLSNKTCDVIYECNDKCSCNSKKCKNRVVGNGSNAKLEVFRCLNPSKGWGVRCNQDLPSGTFLVEYCGEVVRDRDAELKPQYNDEYLFNLDLKIREDTGKLFSSLGMETYDTKSTLDCCFLSREQLEHYLDKNVIDKLDQAGVLERCKQIGENMLTQTPSLRDVDEEEVAFSGFSSRFHSRHSMVMTKRKWSDITTQSDKVSKMSQRPPLFVSQLRDRRRLWQKARDVLFDRTALEIEQNNTVYAIDSR